MCFLKQGDMPLFLSHYTINTTAAYKHRAGDFEISVVDNSMKLLVIDRLYSHFALPTYA
jgi:hypothetical protein